MALRVKTPQEIYHYYESKVDFNAGFVYVTFMEEDPEYSARILNETTGNEHLNAELADGVGGSAAKVGIFKDILTQVVKTFTAYFKYVHCEVAFELSEDGKREFGPDKLLASFVNTNENVSLKLRKFNHKYRWFNLRATPSELCSMLKLACVTVGQRFSASLRNNSVTFPGDENQYGWYCSKHVCTMLRSLNCEMFHLNRTNTVTVDELYHMVECCGHFVDAHMHKLPPIVTENMFGEEAVRNIVYNKQQQ